MLPQRYRPHRTDQPLPQTNSCHNTISPTRIQEPAHTTPSLTIETSYPPTGAENGTSGPSLETMGRTPARMLGKMRGMETAHLTLARPRLKDLPAYDRVIGDPRVP